LQTTPPHDPRPAIKTKSTVELLESRIAPASVRTFTDIDGDKGVATSSMGDLTGKATFDRAGPRQQFATRHSERLLASSGK